MLNLKARLARCQGSVLALLAGACVPLALAPFHFWPLAIVAATALAFLLKSCSAKQGLWGAFAFGVGMYGAGASWVYVAIHDFGNTPEVLALVMTAMFVAGLAVVFALPFAFFCRYIAKTTLGLTLGYSATWVIGEWIRSWLLTGFPWLYLGYAHVDTWLAGWAPVLGVYGLSFITVLTGTVLWQAICLWRTRSLTWPKSAALVLTVLSLWLAGLSLHARPIVDDKNAGAAMLSVAIIQPNIPLAVKWNPLYRDQILEVLREETEPYWEHDLIIWPEASIPLMYHDAEYFLKEISDKALASNTGLIAGILYDDEKPMTFFNSIIGLGRADGIYFKQRLVPFGEYVPLERWLRGLIEFFDLPNSIIFPGPKDQKILSFDTYNIAPSICYEIVYPDLVAELARDAQLLITISNDAWFGSSIGPMQHFQMAQMRALENQRFVIRSTNTGISGVIDPKGRALVVSQQFEREAISSTQVRLLNHHTFFSRWGSTPIVLVCFLILGAMILGQLRRYQRRVVHLPG